jgi:hypothetical protein
VRVLSVSVAGARVARLKKSKKEGVDRVGKLDPSMTL